MVALGNVAAESAAHRDQALQEGCLAPLLAHAASAYTPSRDPGGRTLPPPQWLAEHAAPGRAVHHWARRISRTVPPPAHRARGWPDWDSTPKRLLWPRD
jgi:hypothetical protein